MNRRKRSAKSLVFTPLFRSKTEKVKKGKGSYNRRPRNPAQDSGPSFWRPILFLFALTAFVFKH